jgi:uncharacterized protein (DUF1330 family)
MTAYWIAHVTVTDATAYASYQSLAPAAIAAHGGKFLARGGQATVCEGPDAARHVIIAFPSYAAAMACYNSPEYQQAKASRDGACSATVVIVDGLPTA